MRLVQNNGGGAYKGSHIEAQTVGPSRSAPFRLGALHWVEERRAITPLSASRAWGVA
jgi:hypothetical protein